MCSFGINLLHSERAGRWKRTRDEAEKHESSHEKKGDERAHIESGKEAKTAVGAARAAKKVKNNVRKLRMERMMSKARARAGERVSRH